MFFRKRSGAHYRLLGSDMGTISPPIHSNRPLDGQMAQGRLGAIGQNKGPHHEKHQSRTRRCILGPKHVDLPLLDFVLLWFPFKYKNKT